MADAKQIGVALAAFLPVVRSLAMTAEDTGATGTEKHKAVAEASEKLYRSMQGSVKELRGVPWEAIAPLVVAASEGLIDVVVGLLNRLLGKVWAWFERKGRP